MGMKNRFLNVSYLLNTLVIKTKALGLKWTRGAYPFEYFKDKTKAVISTKFTLKYQDHYHSLAYLDYQKAEKLHFGERSITQDLIVGLVYYNELIEYQKLDIKYLVDLALKLKEKAEFSENGMIFWFNEPYARFDLKGQYYSGIVQGKAASFFLRCHLLTKEERFKKWAKNCLISGWKSTDQGGILRKLPNDHLWVEEYPSPKSSMVLNGHLFYIIGLAEYLSLEEDEILESQFKACLNSVMAWIPNYRQKNGLLYSMYRWNLCNIHYTGIMKYQFAHLYELTGISIFNVFADFTNRLTDWKTFERII